MFQIKLTKAVKHGRTNYRLVVGEHGRAARVFTERLGTYTPVDDRWSNRYLFIRRDRLFHWIAKGATIRSLRVFLLLYPFLLPEKV